MSVRHWEKGTQDYAGSGLWPSEDQAMKPEAFNIPDESTQLNGYRTSNADLFGSGTNAWTAELVLAPFKATEFM